MPSIPFSAFSNHAASRSLSEMAMDAANAVSSNAIASSFDMFGLHNTTRSLSGISSRTSVNGSAILAMEQRHTIQVLAVTTSSFSIASVLLALYWFFMMRRNFRRDLILLLIVGDFWKSMVYWVFAINTFAQGPVHTKGNFCQATGFFLSQGLESCGMS